MANKNRIAYAICSAHGIDTTGMSPKEAWEKAKEVADKNELADLTQDSSKETEKEEPKEEKVDYNALRMGKKQDEGEQKVDYNALRMGKTQPETFNDEPIDYENIEYPKGTSKKYTKYVNEQFENAKPILEKAGIKLEDFGGKPSKEGGYEDNTKEIMNKYVFEPFRKKYPNGNNDVWEKAYQPLYDAIEAVADKNYNDWYIRNNKK